MPMYMEQAVYGNDAGRANSERELHAPFRVQGVNSGAVTWGMQSCGSFSRPSERRSGVGGGHRLPDARLGRRSSIFEVETLLDRGVRNLRDGMARCTSSPVAVSATCTTPARPASNRRPRRRRPPRRTTSAICSRRPAASDVAQGGAGGPDDDRRPTSPARWCGCPPLATRPRRASTHRCAAGSEAGCGGRGSHLIERLTSTTPGFPHAAGGIHVVADRHRAQLDQRAAR
ncbi:MAG: hypothetical protein MZW92_31715 [Comamonadaceae bacterium]|nr:hypothetical protein [Comamonadaceae bacterium]